MLCQANVPTLMRCNFLKVDICTVFQEKLVIEAIKKQLQAQINDSFEQLCRLQEARQQVLADLQDKNIALDIDIEQYNLTEDSPEISYKPDPTRVPKG